MVHVPSNLKNKHKPTLLIFDISEHDSLKLGVANNRPPSFCNIFNCHLNWIFMIVLHSSLNIYFFFSRILYGNVKITSFSIEIRYQQESPLKQVKNIRFDIFFSLYLCSYKYFEEVSLILICMCNHIYREVNTEEGMHKEYLYNNVLFLYLWEINHGLYAAETLSVSSGV